MRLYLHTGVLILTVFQQLVLLHQNLTQLNLELAINIKTSANTALLLCPKHYREIHRKLKSPAPCASCGAKPKRATCFTRHTPATDTTTINKILCDVSREDAVAISVDDCICGSCYKAHLAIVRSIQERHEYCDIKDLIKIWRHKLGETDINNVTRATLHAVLHVANEILNERAVTLPCLCRLFLNVYTTDPEYAYEPQKAQPNEMDKAIVLREAGDIINNLIQNEISKQSCPYIPTTPEDVNIDKIVGEIDPVLWRFLESITRTVRNRKKCQYRGKNLYM